MSSSTPNVVQPGQAAASGQASWAIPAALVLVGAVLPVSVLWFRVIPPFCGVALLLMAIGGDWRHIRHRLASVDKGWAAGLAAFVCVAAASLAWTPDRGKATEVLLIALVFLLLGVVAWAARPSLQPGDLALPLAVGLPVAAALIIVEMHNRTWLHVALGGREDPSRMNQAAVMMALWVWPATKLIGDRWGAGAAVAVFLATAAGVFSSHSETARLGLALAILCAAMSRMGWRSLPVWIGAALAAVVLLQPVLMAATKALIPYVQGIKAGHPAERMTIWVSFAHAVSLAPWAGWGFNGSGTIGFRESLYLFPFDLWNGIRDSHPHNMLLQTWVELGALGALPLAVLVWRTGSLVRDLPWPTLAPYAVGTLAVIPIVALVGYGAWQAWWITLLATLPVLFQVAGRSRPVDRA